MREWIIKDYEKRCFNYLLKLGRVNLEKSYLTEREIKSTVKAIMKKDKCNRLTALKKYKNQLFNEWSEIKNKTGGIPSKEGLNA